MKFKSIFIISLIFCVFLTFSTVNAIDLDNSLDDADLTTSPSESIKLNVSELKTDESVKNLDDVVPGIELQNCDENTNEFDKFSDDMQYSQQDMNSNGLESDMDSKGSKSSVNIQNSNSNRNILSSSVDSNGGTLQATYTVSGNTFDDIQTIINKAKSGDVINLAGKTYSSKGNHIKITKSITINGGSSTATLDAKKLSKIFDVNNNTISFTIMNCNLINGNGRAITALASYCKISNCTFKNCNDTFCGAIYIKNGTNTCILENSNFLDMRCINGSNAGITSAHTYVSNCIFLNNKVGGTGAMEGYGAALQVGQNPLTLNDGYVKNCIFMNNSINIPDYACHGGALCFRPGIKVYNSSFINNYCSGYGGATTLHADGELFDCIFINNSAGQFGGAITTGLSTDDISVNMTNCYFENNSAPHGGAILIKGESVHVIDSFFKDNKANTSYGGAIYILGKNAIITNTSFLENRALKFGAGIFITGSNASISNSTFTKNIADVGAAIYIIGENARVEDSIFDLHSVKNGTVYIKGNSSLINQSSFHDNIGEYGAAVLIEGYGTSIDSSNFTSNNVTKNGGAIYILGSNTRISDSSLEFNNAIPDKADISRGLGGALYIKGNDNIVDGSNFTFNTARNGSAIYTDGINMILNNTVFDKNQAWSYELNVDASPKTSDYNESDILIDIKHIGGNNIANAIYNTASTEDIYFYNVQYESSRGVHTTGENEIHPVLGAENSKNGTLLYQDDREDNQLVEVVVLDNSTGSAILNESFKTGILGNITFNLSSKYDETLNPGRYSVHAMHVEDPYYKEISNLDDFEIVALVDLSIDKICDVDVADINETVTYTIHIINKGPNNASGVYVDEVLENGLELVSSEASKGSYADGLWDVGSLSVGEEASLVITAISREIGELFNEVNVVSNEKEINESDNSANKTIFIKSTDLSIDITASQKTLNLNDAVDFTVFVENRGFYDADDVNVSIADLEDLGFIVLGDLDYKTWFIGDLKPGENRTMNIKARVNCTNRTVVVPADVRSSTYETDYSNNFDEDSVEILPLCDLAISINPDNEVVNSSSGAVVKWTVVVENNGPDTAENATVILSHLDDLVVLDSSLDTVESGEGLSFNIGNIPSGGKVSFVVSTHPNVTDKTITVNSKTETPTPEFVLTNNVDDGSVLVMPLCDLVIDVEVEPGVVNLSDDVVVNITVTVSNEGPDKAENVSVDLNSSLVNQTIDIGDLEPGENKTIIIPVVPDVSNVNVTVVSNVSGDTYEEDLTNNKDDDILEVLPLTDVAVSIVCDRNPVNFTNDSSCIINWTITAVNNGPDKASDVCVDLTDFKTFGLVVLNSSDNAYDQDVNTWTIGDLSAGEKMELIVSTMPGESDKSVVIYSNISTSDYESNLENNRDSAGTVILPLCDLIISIESNPGVVNLTNDSCSDVNLTINVSNSGPDKAQNVTVCLNDLEELGFDIVDSTVDVPGASFDKENKTWSIGDVDSGDGAIIIVTVNPNKSNMNVTAIVETRTPTYEISLENNKDDTVIEVLPICDLVITITSDKEVINLSEILQKINSGELSIEEFANSDLTTVNWTITVTNNGPDDALDVVMHNILPEELEFISYLASQGILRNGLNESVENISNDSNESGEVYYDLNGTDFEDLNGTDYEYLDDDNGDYDGMEDNIDDYELDDDSASGDSSAGSASSSLDSEDGADDGSTYDKSSRDLRWSIGTLKAGESANLVLSTRALSTGSIIENVSVSTSTYESDLTNNNDSANVTVFEEEPPQEEPAENNTDDGSYDETEEEIPDFAFDYHVPKDADDKNRSDLKKVSNNPAKTSKVKAVNKSINMKNTGNPLIVLALSILGLFVVQSRRKN